MPPRSKIDANDPLKKRRDRRHSTAMDVGAWHESQHHAIRRQMRKGSLRFNAAPMHRDLHDSRTARCEVSASFLAHFELIILELEQSAAKMISDCLVATMAVDGANVMATMATAGLPPRGTIGIGK